MRAAPIVTSAAMALLALAAWTAAQAADQAVKDDKPSKSGPPARPDFKRLREKWMERQKLMRSGQAGKSSDKPATAPPPVDAAAAARVFEGAPATVKTPLDKLVFERLKELNIAPARSCSDAVFVRRAYLDVIGTLPTPKEAWEFISDNSPDKRQALIDRLLERDEFADYWAMKWGDLLRVKAEFPINLWPNAAQAYYSWIRQAVKSNMPYDRFARELLTQSGSNFRVPAVNFYRAMQDRAPTGTAKTVALTFLGQRADKWPAQRLEGLAAFFTRLSFKSTAEWKEEIVYYDPDKKLEGPAATWRATFPDGRPAILRGDRDPRETFADWLVSDPQFAQCMANRAWSWLVGRGIVHESDDFRADNPPSNPELLAYLQQELVRSKYDLKHLLRVILNSQTYQLSSVPASKDPKAEACFAYYPIRRLEAEVLVDALCQITGTTERYSSPIPEPFTYIPENCRSIALPDGSITSSFLELFGKPPRDTGMEMERNNRITAAQRLHLLNSSHVQRKLEQSWKLRAMLASRNTPRESANAVYMTILSRPPTDGEVRTAAWYAESSGLRGQEAAIDLAWALINSSEFLYRH